LKFPHQSLLIRKVVRKGFGSTAFLSRFDLRDSILFGTGLFAFPFSALGEATLPLLFLFLEPVGFLSSLVAFVVYALGHGHLLFSIIVASSMEKS